MKFDKKQLKRSLDEIGESVVDFGRSARKEFGRLVERGEKVWDANSSML